MVHDGCFFAETLESQGKGIINESHACEVVLKWGSLNMRLVFPLGKQNRRTSKRKRHMSCEREEGLTEKPAETKETNPRCSTRLD